MTDAQLSIIYALILEHYDYRFKSLSELSESTKLWYQWGDPLEGTFPTPIEYATKINKSMISFNNSELSLVCLVLDIEDKLNIEILDEEADAITTIKELINLVEQKILPA